MNKQSELSVLWIEDQLDELTVHVAEFESGLSQRLKVAKINRDKALTVEQAEAKLEALQSAPPDLIVLDLMLPRSQEAQEAKRVDMDAGYFLWFELRRAKTWGKALAEVPILIVTARGNPPCRSAMEKDNELKWLAKPVAPSEIVEAVVELLEGSKSNG